MLENNVACHFYSNMMCIEDIETEQINLTFTSIWLIDSCQKIVIQFLHGGKSGKISIQQVYKINSGTPLSAISLRLSKGLFVLTKNPNKLNLAYT